MSCYGSGSSGSSKLYSGGSTSGYRPSAKESYVAAAPVVSNYQRPSRDLGIYTRALSSDNSAALNIDDNGLPSYLSYLGVPITEPMLGEHLLGQTNGKRINISADVDPTIKNFILFHEEEHIKDMNASEWDIDRRAIHRLIVSKKPVSWIKVKLLLKSRWKEKADLIVSDEMIEELACK
jgi:hypothetical protein